jgi:mannose-6-phosphate isomerase-like protein (cupin superfamily)
MTANQDGLLLQPSQGTSFWVLGDLYTFKAVGKDTGEVYALFEILVQSPNPALPYIHSLEDKAFYVLEGEIEFQLDDRTIVAIAGTFLHSPKGQLHSFKNAGSKPAKMLCWVMPAGLEEFFAEVGRSVKEQFSGPPPVSPTDIERVMATAPNYGIEIIESN